MLPDFLRHRLGTEASRLAVDRASPSPGEARRALRFADCNDHTYALARNE